MKYINFLLRPLSGSKSFPIKRISLKRFLFLAFCCHHPITYLCLACGNHSGKGISENSWWAKELLIFPLFSFVRMLNVWTVSTCVVWEILDYVKNWSEIICITLWLLRELMQFSHPWMDQKMTYDTTLFSPTQTRKICHSLISLIFYFF